MFEIIFANAFFWINFVGVIAFVAFMYFKSSEYALVEGGIQIGATFLYLLLIYFICFTSTYKIWDKEILTTKIDHFSYYEQWDELVVYYTYIRCGKSTIPVMHTRIDHHSPYWTADYKDGSVRIEMSSYAKAQDKYGGRFVALSHGGQVSHGDGNKYESYPTDVIPISFTHNYENWIRASMLTILKKQGVSQLITNNLVNLAKYPGMIDGEYGQPYFYRVINFTTNNLDSIEKSLSEYCGEYSPEKKINLLMYVVQNQPRDFKNVLEYYWEGTKKNDSVVLISVDKKGQIQWSDTMSFTKNGMYLTELRHLKGNINKDGTKIASEIISNVNENWSKTSMKDYEYLKKDLTLPMSSQIIIVILNILLTVGISIYFTHNDINKDTMGV